MNIRSEVLPESTCPIRGTMEHPAEVFKVDFPGYRIEVRCASCHVSVLAFVSRDLMQLAERQLQRIAQGAFDRHVASQSTTVQLTVGEATPALEGPQ